MKKHLLVSLVLASALFVLQPLLKSQGPASPQAPPASLESLSAGVYFQSAEGWKALESARPTSLSVKSFPKWYRGGSLNEMHFNYAGAKAPLQLDQRRPVFGFRKSETASGLDARQFILIRLAPKKDHRELTLLHAQYQGPP